MLMNITFSSLNYCLRIHIPRNKLFIQSEDMNIESYLSKSFYKFISIHTWTSVHVCVSVCVYVCVCVHTLPWVFWFGLDLCYHQN